MNLKQRFSLIFSLIFSILLGVVLFILYTLFSNYREEEFRESMIETGQSTFNLVIVIKEAGDRLSKQIDNNAIITLFNEKVLIFNDSLTLIYSTVKDEAVNWSKTDLDNLKNKDYIFRSENFNDVIGLKKQHSGSNYFIIVSALDKYGLSKLNYLKYLLITAYLISSIIVWGLSFYLSRRSLAPLDLVTEKITEISEKNLSTRLNDSGRNDEVSALAHSFNHMLERIDKSFNYQKSFVGNASHELRTPIARISLQLENLVNSGKLSEDAVAVIRSITEDTHELSDIVSSLLVLSRIDNRSFNLNSSKIRLDEIIFSSAEYLRKIYPDFKIFFEIINESIRETNLEIEGDESLLKIAFNNLLKNAYMYSDNKEVRIKLRQRESDVEVILTNSGPVPEINETSELFNAFFRGANAVHSKGYGLGLSIVQRIMQYHQAEVRYLIPGKDINQLITSFKI
jgi:two-component system sensor histidine kinase ArlS